MAELTWDDVGDRWFESGVDHGVIYLPNGTAVAWNGLMGITESVDTEVTPIYYDGMKIHDIVSIGSFSASLKAMTYPTDFMALEGLAAMRPGFFAGEQPPTTFALSYRVKVGNDVDPDAGYKIHVLYNVVAIPKDRTHESMGSTANAEEFEWEIYPVPGEVPGFKPTGHFMIDTTELDPLLLQQLEAQLYGSSTANASLMTLDNLVAFINDWYRVKITDNGDGTWTAYSPIEGAITLDPVTQQFTITQANAIFTDVNTYMISDTKHISDIT